MIFFIFSARQKDLTNYSCNESPCTQYGASNMLKTLTKGWNKNTLNSLDGSYLLENALKSDNAETVQIVLDLVQDIFF